ncbi:MAG TPA: DUF115 domain-containing protein [Acetivibrio sp.]|uniref:motility associated factor glycosyltransferase family protein n=1 Tax=Acetivibrio sp. TaxID=1872092 RepID=UPI002B89A3A5|nr:6-hydroxymethylpterin diphosphokinase MptE-like protein [Acetivibrio sp.]HOM02865.1 DUF115 domain-containing protein [Acetivibrio sp.]
MSEVLDRNLSLLKEYQPDTYKKIDKYIKGEYVPKDNSVEKILLARQDDLIINIMVRCSRQDFLLCDHENPINEAYAWIDKYIDPSNKADIVFGMGMAFHLEVLLTSFPNKKVIIVEPNIDLFYQIVCIRNLEPVIKKAEIIVDEDLDVILEKINSLFWDTEKGGIQVQPFEVYGEMFPEKWDKLRDSFIKLANNFTVDIATRRKFGELWVHNNIKNLNKISEASDAGVLVGKFKGIPGVLVSAGPSLEKNIRLLKGLEDKCVIMAAGTAVRIMESFDLSPHFMVGIDAGDKEGEIHSNVKNKDIYFIYSNQVSIHSVKGYTGPKFVMNYPVDMYTAGFFEYANIKSDFFLSGPSVANTCFDILFKMGCDPIIIIGQDMAFTFGSMYAGEAPGTVVNDVVDVQKRGYILAKDIYGNEVYTTRPFLAMKNWFEGYFEKIEGRTEIINATEGGLNILHARNETLEAALKSCKLSEAGIKQHIKLLHEEGRFDDSTASKIEEYKAYVQKEIRRLDEVSKRQLETAEYLRRDVYHPSKNRSKFIKAVNSINEMSDRVFESPIYHSLLKNLVEIDFYLIKAEVERAVKILTKYDDIKNIYVNAILSQNEKLSTSLDKLKRFFEGE